MINVVENKKYILVDEGNERIRRILWTNEKS